MNKETFIKLALAGKPLVLVEYRSFTEEVIRYRDKKTGSAVEKPIIKHAVEMASSQVQVTEWLPDGYKPGAMVPPFKKGEMVVLEIEGMNEEKGFYRASGALHEFENDTAASVKK